MHIHWCCHEVACTAVQPAGSGPVHGPAIHFVSKFEHIHRQQAEDTLKDSLCLTIWFQGGTAHEQATTNRALTCVQFVQCRSSCSLQQIGRSGRAASLLLVLAPTCGQCSVSLCCFHCLSTDLEFSFTMLQIECMHSLMHWGCRDWPWTAAHGSKLRTCACVCPSFFVPHFNVYIGNRQSTSLRTVSVSRGVGKESQHTHKQRAHL